MELLRAGCGPALPGRYYYYLAKYKTTIIPISDQIRQQVTSKGGKKKKAGNTAVV